MSGNIDPLEYHHKIGIKLDYFILGADVALLGWTVVNTDWLPKESFFVFLIGGFWMLIILSILSGIICQMYKGMAFGLNHFSVEAGNLASEIERNTVAGGNFKNQQTGEILSAEMFKTYGVTHRDRERKFNQRFDVLERLSRLWGSASVTLLAIALFLFVDIRLIVLSS